MPLQATKRPGGLKIHLWWDIVPPVTSILDRKARIVIPSEMRAKLDLVPGDQVELQTNGKTITVSKVKKSRNEGLVDLLLACPVKDFMPERRRDITRAPKL